MPKIRDFGDWKLPLNCEVGGWKVPKIRDFGVWNLPPPPKDLGFVKPLKFRDFGFTSLKIWEVWGSFTPPPPISRGVLGFRLKFGGGLGSLICRTGGFWGPILGYKI